MPRKIIKIMKSQPNEVMPTVQKSNKVVMRELSKGTWVEFDAALSESEIETKLNGIRAALEHNEAMRFKVNFGG